MNVVSVLSDLIRALRAHLAVAEIMLDRGETELAVEELSRVRDRLAEAVVELDR